MASYSAMDYIFDGIATISPVLYVILQCDIICQQEVVCFLLLNLRGALPLIYLTTSNNMTSKWVV